MAEDNHHHHNDDDDNECIFVEILGPAEEQSSNNNNSYLIEAYVATVEPQACGPLVKRLANDWKLGTTATLGTSNRDDEDDGPLAQPPVINLLHLKRVKRTMMMPNTEKDLSHTSAPDEEEETDTTNMNNAATKSPESKRQRTTSDESNRNKNNNNKIKKGKTNLVQRLQVLLGAKRILDEKLSSSAQHDPSSVTHILSQTYGLHEIDVVLVPARPPRSAEEYEQFKRIWPTAFYNNQTDAYQQAERQLSEMEIVQMRQGMEAALLDAQQAAAVSAAAAASAPALAHPRVFRTGTVIVDPRTGEVVGRGAPERALQLQQQQQQIVHDDARGGYCNSYYNPLAATSSLLYALQSVSRRERDAALQQGMDSADFQTGQYLCTGYDVYTTLEPNVWEAMAAVHSRIRRLIVGCCPCSTVAVAAATGIRTTPPTNANDDDGANTQIMDDPATALNHATTAPPTTTTTTTTISTTSKRLASGLIDYNVHALPGTNHKYRAFLCQQDGALARRCIAWHSHES